MIKVRRYPKESSAKNINNSSPPPLASQPLLPLGGGGGFSFGDAMKFREAISCLANSWLCRASDMERKSDDISDTDNELIQRLTDEMSDEAFDALTATICSQAVFLCMRELTALNYCQVIDDADDCDQQEPKETISEKEINELLDFCESMHHIDRGLS